MTSSKKFLHLFRIKFPTKTYFGFFRFGKLTQWCYFVTYLSNYPWTELLNSVQFAKLLEATVLNWSCAVQHELAFCFSPWLGHFVKLNWRWVLFSPQSVVKVWLSLVEFCWLWERFASPSLIASSYIWSPTLPPFMFRCLWNVFMFCTFLCFITSVHMFYCNFVSMCIWHTCNKPLTVLLTCILGSAL